MDKENEKQSADFEDSLLNKFSKENEINDLEKGVLNIMERIKAEAQDSGYLEQNLKKIAILKDTQEMELARERNAREAKLIDLEIKGRRSDIARQNIQVLCYLIQNQVSGLETDLIKEIDKNIQFTKIEVDEPEEIEVFAGGVSITSKGLKKALARTNVIDVMREAKKNGWEMRITDEEIALYKDGKRILDGYPKEEFSETPSHIEETEKK